MEKYTLPSGAILEITPLPFEEAWGICQDVISEIKDLGIDLKGDLKDLFEKDHAALMTPLCSILASKKINEAVKRCFVRATYNGIKIDSSTFSDVKTRGDFLPCAFYVLKVNISPFFENLLSFLKV